MTLTFEIEEPIDKMAMPRKYQHWTEFFQNIAVRLAALDGAALPVKFPTPQAAALCRLALKNRERIAYGRRYPGFDKRLQGFRRENRVFFWLEKDEVSA